MGIHGLKEFFEKNRTNCSNCYTYYLRFVAENYNVSYEQFLYYSKIYGKRYEVINHKFYFSN